MNKKDSDYEIGCLSIVSFIVFVALLVLKLKNIFEMPWFIVFSPFIGLFAISVSMNLHNNNKRKD